MQARVTVVLLGLCLGGCQDYPFVPLAERRAEVTHLHEVVVQGRDTDILMVIDNSPSMTEEQANLQRNARRFIEELSKSSNKYRVGIITTDPLSPEDGGRLRSVGDGLPYLERPDIGAPDAEEQRERLIQRFIDIVGSLGTGGSGKEGGLDVALRAVDAAVYPEVAAYNAGFLRSSADLAIIFVTDEDDCSFADYGIIGWEPGACYQHASEAIDPSFYVGALSDLKGSAGIAKLRAAMVAGGIRRPDQGFTLRGCYLTQEGPASDCGCSSSADDPYFCSLLAETYGAPCDSIESCNHLCEAMPASRYAQLIEELGDRRVAAGLPRGTYSDSICQPDYGDALAEIAHSIVDSGCFVLDRPASGPEMVSVLLRRAGGDAAWSVPRYDPEDPAAACTSCDGCPRGAWRYASSTSICLDCGLQKSTGDEYFITVVHEPTGGQP